MITLFHSIAFCNNSRHSEANHTAGNITVARSPVSNFDNNWFMLTLAAVVFAILLFGQIYGIMTSLFLVTASRRLYNNMFEVVLRAPMYFYETNPVGKYIMS